MAKYGEFQGNSRRWIPRPVRRKLLSRRCYVCGERKSKRIEHVTPLWKGGSNRPANLAGICVPCAKSKDAREAAERAALRPWSRKRKAAVRGAAAFRAYVQEHRSQR